MAFEAPLLPPCEVEFRRPTAHEIENYRSFLIGRKPFLFYFALISRVLGKEGKPVYLEAWGRHIPKLLNVALLLSGVKIVKAWIWLKKGSRFISFVGLGLALKPVNRGVERYLLRAGDRFIYEGGKWRRRVRG